MKASNNLPICVFWFRRDLRLHDNKGLYEALSSGLPVLPLFIFDSQILNELNKEDKRVSFIYDSLVDIHNKLKVRKSGLCIENGLVEEVWKKVLNQFNVQKVVANHDYEPYAIKRDEQIKTILNSNGVDFETYKDQVIFEKFDIVKDDRSPYTVYTPYMKRWLRAFTSDHIREVNSENTPGFLKWKPTIPSLDIIGFTHVDHQVKSPDLTILKEYEKFRDIPFLDKTSYLSVHLRFGTVSTRQMVKKAYDTNIKFLQELIWREFFMQILFHFPHVVTQNFKSAYDKVEWINNHNDFERWSNGITGYPMVDAGMRQLNATGYMHNRVRMVVAGFLCKHLLIDWRMGEAYFAQKLLDYELSSNNGNWQWAAGTGCDAAPYFRVFNPETQFRKFDATEEYVKKWIPEFQTSEYPTPMIDHKFARERAIETYKNGLNR